MMMYLSWSGTRTSLAAAWRPGAGRLAGMAVVAVVTAVVLVAGCQGNPRPPTPAESAGYVPSALPAYHPTVGPSVVKTRHVKGYGRILTDHRGLTIYTNNGSVNTKVAQCTGACTSIWHPVVVGTEKLDDPGTLGVHIGVLPRQGGLHQLAVNGHRAYTFLNDGPGRLAGDLFITGGPKGANYTWRAVRVDKNAPARVALNPGK